MHANRLEHAERASVYSVLAQHQVEESWACRDAIARLQEWADRLNVHFNLRVPEIVLCIGKLTVGTKSRFQFGHNAFGLKGEIAINGSYLNDPPHELIAVVLRELLHAWQQAHGRPSKYPHHNKELRDKALEIGLIVDARGAASLAAESPFKELLAAHGVAVPDGEVATAPRKKLSGKSSLKKWSCGCTNVRCAVAEFYAQCLRCGQVFRLQANDAEGRAEGQPGA